MKSFKVVLPNIFFIFVVSGRCCNFPGFWAKLRFEGHIFYFLAWRFGAEFFKLFGLQFSLIVKQLMSTLRVVHRFAFRNGLWSLWFFWRTSPEAALVFLHAICIFVCAKCIELFHRWWATKQEVLGPSPWAWLIVLDLKELWYLLHSSSVWAYWARGTPSVDSLWVIDARLRLLELRRPSCLLDSLALCRFIQSMRDVCGVIHHVVIIHLFCIVLASILLQRPY